MKVLTNVCLIYEYICIYSTMLMYMYIYILVCVYIYIQHCSLYVYVYVCVCIIEYLNMLYKKLQSLFRSRKNTFGCACSSHFSCVQLYVILWTIAHQSALGIFQPRTLEWVAIPSPWGSS